MSMEAMATACNANAECTGFNSTGFLKNSNHNLTHDTGSDFYIKDSYTPTDGYCKRRNPGTPIIKSVRTKCRVAGCNSALGGSGWIDFCNAGHEEYTCCGSNGEPAAPPPNPSQPVSAVLGEHCGRGQGWQRNLMGTGSFSAGSAFPGDASYITVMGGYTATLFARNGANQVVNGPGEFNFCSRGGFNDSVVRIDIRGGSAPASNPIPTDATCRSRNPGRRTVKAVRTKCRVAGCNSALGGRGWIDFCNAGHEDYTCCGK